MNEEIRQALNGGSAAARQPSTEPVRVAEYGGWLAVVTIDSGTRHNAMSAAAWTRLAEVCASLRWGDHHPRVVVIRGGRSAFSAGADITEFPALRQSAQDAAGYNARVSAALRALMELPMPVVAMVSGDAVGGVCEIAAACDVRIAAHSARLGLPLARLGVVQGPVEQQAVLRLIGQARLKWLVFSGRLLMRPRRTTSGWSTRWCRTTSWSTRWARWWRASAVPRRPAVGRPSTWSTTGGRTRHHRGGADGALSAGLRRA